MNKLETRIEICRQQHKILLNKGDVAGALNALEEAAEHQSKLDARLDKIDMYASKRDQRYGRGWIGAD